MLRLLRIEGLKHDATAPRIRYSSPVLSSISQNTCAGGALAAGATSLHQLCPPIICLCEALPAGTTATASPKTYKYLKQPKFIDMLLPGVRPTTAAVAASVRLSSARRPGLTTAGCAAWTGVLSQNLLPTVLTSAAEPMQGQLNKSMNLFIENVNSDEPDPRMSPYSNIDWNYVMNTTMWLTLKNLAKAAAFTTLKTVLWANCSQSTCAKLFKGAGSAGGAAGDTDV